MVDLHHAQTAQVRPVLVWIERSKNLLVADCPAGMAFALLGIAMQRLGKVMRESGKICGLRSRKDISHPLMKRR
jgi:hypothetical protein